MQGRILDFNKETGMGVISSEEGSRYTFHKDSFKSSGEIISSLMVDFIAEGENANEIYKVASSEENSVDPAIAKTSTAAIVSLITGIAGLFFFGSLIAIITGHVARANIKNSKGRLQGSGFATTGLITGYIGLVLTFLVLIAVAIPKLAATRDDANSQKLMYEKQLQEQMQKLGDYEN